MEKPVLLSFLLLPRAMCQRCVSLGFIIIVLVKDLFGCHVPFLKIGGILLPLCICAWSFSHQRARPHSSLFLEATAMRQTQLQLTSRQPACSEHGSQLCCRETPFPPMLLWLRSCPSSASRHPFPTWGVSCACTSGAVLYLHNLCACLWCRSSDPVRPWALCPLGQHLNTCRNIQMAGAFWFTNLILYNFNALVWH